VSNLKSVLIEIDQPSNVRMRQWSHFVLTVESLDPAVTEYSMTVSAMSFRNVDERASIKFRDAGHVLEDAAPTMQAFTFSACLVALLALFF
jgi:hypothetical protein